MTAELPDSDRGSSVNSQRDLGVRAGSTRRGYLAAMCSVSGVRGARCFAWHLHCWRVLLCWRGAPLIRRRLPSHASLIR